MALTPEKIARWNRQQSGFFDQDGSGHPTREHHIADQGDGPAVPVQQSADQLPERAEVSE
ncbi:hypothetical protein ACWCYY_18450 [Kitasatospora sp. NPDC001664]